MQPHILIERLASLLNLPDFILCDTLVLNGSPQSCFFLFCFFYRYLLFCWPTTAAPLKNYLVKLSDDAALLSLLQGAGSHHGCALPAVVKRCEDIYLVLNVTKTKERVIDFRKSNTNVSTIHSEDICWFNVLFVKDTDSLNNIVRIYPKIIWVQQSVLNSLRETAASEG